MNYFSQDGLRLSIKFANQPEYELDVDTQEDKNKVSVWGGKVGVKIESSARGTRVLYSLLAGSVWGKGGREDRIQCTWYSVLYSLLAGSVWGKGGRGEDRIQCTWYSCSVLTECECVGEGWV